METKYYLVKLNPWSWMKTENLSSMIGESEPYYDFSAEGHLFISVENDCPLCGAKDSLTVAASAVDDLMGNAKSWHCAACDSAAEVEQGFGTGALTPRDPRDDHFYMLPSYIVISEGR